jgi:hypothetical protein
MANKNSTYVGSLVSFLNDTKPYHSKLTEIIEEYRFSDDMTVDIKERLFTNVTAKGAWMYSHFANGVSTPAPQTPIHRVVSPLFRGFTKNSVIAENRGAFKVGRDENTDLPLVPFAYDPTALEGIGLADAFLQRKGDGATSEPLLEGHDVFLSHGAYVFQVKQAQTMEGQYLPLFAERRTEGVLAHATAVVQAQALDKTNPSSAISRVQLILTQIAAQLAITPDTDSQAALDATQLIVNDGDLPHTYEALTNALAAADVPVIPSGGYFTWAEVHKALGACTTSMFRNSYNDLTPRSDGSGIGRETGMLYYSSITELDRDDIKVTNIIPNINRPEYEEWTLRAATSNTFFVTGSSSGVIGVASMPGVFNAPQIRFTLSAGTSPMVVGTEIQLTPQAKVTIHKDSSSETWSIIKVNPMAYSRPVLTSTRYGYVQDDAGVVNMINIVDLTFPTSTIVLTALTATTFSVTNTAEPFYQEVAEVNTTFNDGRLIFSIRQGTSYTFEPGDRFYIDVLNEEPTAKDLDLSYGFDMDPYDGAEWVYNTVNDAVQDYLTTLDFGYDSRFTAYDLYEFGLQITQSAVDGRQWRLRAIADESRPLLLQNSTPTNKVNLIASLDPTNPDAATKFHMDESSTDVNADLELWYSSSFALEFYSEDETSWMLVDTINVGDSYSNEEEGISFKLVEAGKPFIAARARSTWSETATALYTEDFTSWTRESGPDLFTFVSTPYGQGVNVDSQDNEIHAVLVKELDDPFFAETIKIKFKVDEALLDDAAVFEFLTDGDTIAINPRREAAFDSARRPVAYIGTESKFISTDTLVDGEWYEAMFTLAAGAGNTTVRLTRLSNGVFEETAFTGDHPPATISWLNINVDSGNPTCPTSYADVQLLGEAGEVMTDVTDGGDVIGWTVLNQPPVQTTPAGIVSHRVPRLVPRADNFFETVPAKWTVQMIGPRTYSIQGVHTTGVHNGSPVLSTPITVNMATDGRSYYNTELNIHWTIHEGMSGLLAPDAFLFETYEKRPMFLVHGSVSGWNKPASINEWYWNGKIGFKFVTPEVAVFEDGLLLGAGSPWTSSIGLITLQRLRDDTTSCVYTIKALNDNWWTLYRNGAVVGGGEFSVSDKFVQFGLPIAEAGKTFVVDLVSDDYNLAMGHDLAIVRTSAGRAPTNEDFVLFSRTRSDDIRISINSRDPVQLASFAPLGLQTTDLRVVDHTTGSGVPLVNTSPETGVLRGWIPTLITKLDGTTQAEFSDPATHVVVRAATTGELVGTVRSIGTSLNEPVIFSWDSVFASKYLPLNAEATIVTYGNGMNENIHVNMTEGIAFMISGGGLDEDSMYQDVLHVSVTDSYKFYIKANYSNVMDVVMSDGPFTGFLPGYDNMPYDGEDGVDGYYDAGQALTDHFITAKMLALKDPVDLTPQEQATMLDLSSLVNPYLTDGDITGTTLEEFVQRLSDDDAINYTPTGFGFGIPAIGLGISVKDEPTASAATAIVEAFTARAVDTNGYSMYGYDADGLDTPPDTVTMMYPVGTGPFGALPGGGVLYADFVTPMVIDAPGSQLIEISFSQPTAVIPTIYLWRPTDAAPQQVPVVERVNNRVFRFRQAQASELKLIVI